LGVYSAFQADQPDHRQDHRHADRRCCLCIQLLVSPACFRVSLCLRGETRPIKDRRPGGCPQSHVLSVPYSGREDLLTAGLPAASSCYASRLVPQWRYWLIDLPAKVVSVWFKAYVVIAYALTTAAFLMALLGLVLYLFGVPL
jgi:hypothetical protein